MAGLDELQQLLGAPTPRRWSPDEWAEVENYVGSSLPSDFKAFMDTYGPGVIAQELVVFHLTDPARCLSACAASMSDSPSRANVARTTIRTRFTPSRAA